MYNYITENDEARIFDDIINYSDYNEFSELKEVSEEVLKAAIKDFCNIYYGFNYSIEGIAEVLTDFVNDILNDE